MPYVTHFIRSQFTSLPVPTHSFAGQTIIVTGANTGLGFDAAQHFARLDSAKVIIACRNAEKGERAKQAIEAKVNRKDVVEVWALDLSSPESVKQFAKRAETLDRIDALIENAGLVNFDFKRAETGDEEIVAVNVVGTMLLCCMMIPVLEKSARKWNTRPRLTVVTSEVHHFTSFKEGEKEDIFAELADEKKADIPDRYNVSKIMEVYAVRAIAPKLTAKASPVVLNMVNPGFCFSDFLRAMAPFKRAIVKMIQSIIARSTEAGSRNLVYAGAVGEESHGCYLLDCKNEPNAVSRKVRSAEGTAMQEKVWKQLAAKLEGIEPGVTAVVA